MHEIKNVRMNPSSPEAVRRFEKSWWSRSRASISWVRSRTKVKAIHAWGRLWRSQKHSDHVRLSIRSNPTWKLSKFHDSIGKNRKGHCRLIQVILGHGFFGEYYQRFKVDEPAECQCDHQTLQTIAHVIRHCPLLDVARAILRKVSKPVLLSDLFGTIKGLRALAVFLNFSNAFSKFSPPDYC
ncbi:extracellular metalloproteinase MEP [Ceratobasidium sp. AG-Ba]|nr:extracellular metalloproteinase MEP [Ceratobasidium sp. AG-Ba]